MNIYHIIIFSFHINYYYDVNDLLRWRYCDISDAFSNIRFHSNKTSRGSEFVNSTNPAFLPAWGWFLTNFFSNLLVFYVVIFKVLQINYSLLISLLFSWDIYIRTRFSKLVSVWKKTKFNQRNFHDVFFSHERKYSQSTQICMCNQSW